VIQGGVTNLGVWNSWHQSIPEPMTGRSKVSIQTIYFSTNLQNQLIPAFITVDGLGRQTQRFPIALWFQ
jgi:hypothetical protein